MTSTLDNPPAKLEEHSPYENEENEFQSNNDNNENDELDENSDDGSVVSESNTLVSCEAVEPVELSTSSTHPVVVDEDYGSYENDDTEETLQLPSTVTPLSEPFDIETPNRTTGGTNSTLSCVSLSNATTTSTTNTNRTTPSKDNELEQKLSALTVQKKVEDKCASRSASTKSKGRRKRRKKYLTINLTTCKYECVRRVSKKFGFRCVEDGEDWVLFWTDYSVSLERVMSMRSYQKINHFPGMSEICRKDLLARNMNRLWKQFPKEYAIFPKTWCLPADFGDFQSFCRTKKNKTFILKPDSGSQGKGIFLTKNSKDIKPGEDLICQQYVSKPFLIDGLKFDLRIYVLVTSCDPLRIFVYNDGLARFSTVQYSEPNGSNLENVYMHLTNYAIQKSSSEFVRGNEESGSKRRLSVIDKWFQDHGYDLDKIWASIEDAIIKTLVSAHPILKHNYRTCFPNHVRGSACFEVLGFDVLLDHKLKPWILEVNHSPSFTTDSKLDREIKDGMIYNTLALVNFSSTDKKKYIDEEKKRVKERLMQKGRGPKDNFTRTPEYVENLQRYEDKHKGNFRRIYPENNEQKYEAFFANSCSLFQETAASKARVECARLQRAEIQNKSEHIERMRKLNSAGVVTGVVGAGELRPESGHPKKSMVFNRLSSCKDKQKINKANVDKLSTVLPLPINEKEEYERIGGMMQRDTLLRMLGIPDFVKELLTYKGSIAENPDIVSLRNQDAPKSFPVMNTNIFTLVDISSDLKGSSNAAHRHTDNLISALQSKSNAHYWNSSRPSLMGRKTLSCELPNPFDNGKSKPGILGSSEKPSFQRLDRQDRNRILNKDVNNNDTQIPATHKSENLINVVKNPLTKRNTFSGSSHILSDRTSHRKVLHAHDDLSVISSAAPMQIRMEAKVDDKLKFHPSFHKVTNFNRSTRAQRVRGASNTMRLKQLELLESRSGDPS